MARFGTYNGPGVTNWLSPAKLVATSLEEMFAKVSERDDKQPAIAEYKTVEEPSVPKPRMCCQAKVERWRGQNI